MERNCTLATLVATLRASKPGDVLRVSGKLAQFTLVGLRFAEPGVTLIPDDGASIEGWSSFTQCSGITIRGFKVLAPRSGAAIGVMRGCSHMTFVGCEFTGPGSLPDGGSGLALRDSTDIAVRGCRFHDIGGGIGINNVTNLSITDNDFRDLWYDSIAGGSTNTTLERNFFTNFRGPSLHLDAMQFWGTGLAGAPADIRIIDNRYERGDGNPAQFIFMSDSVLGYQRVTIRGNSAYGPSWHGCTIVGATDTLVEDNFFQGIIEADPKAQTITPWIRFDRPGENVVQRNNVIAKNAKRGDRKALGQWLTGRVARGGGEVSALDGQATGAGLALAGFGAVLASSPTRRGALLGAVAQALATPLSKG